MTVYVDCTDIPYGRMIMSHMMADTVEELHAMAAKIGVPRSAFQGDHYDICKAKRSLAQGFGAKTVTSCFLVGLRRRSAVSVRQRLAELGCPTLGRYRHH